MEEMATSYGITIDHNGYRRGTADIPLTDLSFPRHDALDRRLRWDALCGWTVVAGQCDYQAIIQSRSRAKGVGASELA